MVSVPEITLNSGHIMPLLGMGTAVYPSVGSNAFITSEILRAIELGYRHFDTASIYQTEQSLGEAIAQALHQGLIKSRQELFITSKLWCNDAHADLVLPALHKTLRNLQLDYLDLYLIHLPVSFKPGQFQSPPPKEDLMPMDIKSVWAAMEECQRLGLTRSIGVSNFSCKRLSDLLLNVTIPPAVNQVEMNPLWQQKKLREFCESKGIHVTGYSPLGAKGTNWGTNRVMECKELGEIAKARGKTIAQVCLRWVHEQGVSVVVKSFNKERMKENLGIFDWALSEEDSQKISQIQQFSAFPIDIFVSADGPFKSAEEFWDGEI
ncbi:non-functional NADPH-dependent codeinone reductase 2-like isoform X2 [Macadamia integrifolia]|uniref:non-functional NADPH-dependent codeinone reductase 2-like isoform X1 n=1 Tax=Macadamia integrifolia TaxID=60698 RepID=UPI001C4FAB4C|nr:non-functional NADPH-dependent codeinone reductase 2-like isoform X1 [Macadamia integrifolia]XP_042504444.1 non-functional NADPH-dependent codeinone reductase 2-like isoform X2 [Macadamia integrifolia]